MCACRERKPSPPIIADACISVRIAINNHARTIPGSKSDASVLPDGQEDLVADPPWPQVGLLYGFDEASCESEKIIVTEREGHIIETVGLQRS